MLCWSSGAADPRSFEIEKRGNRANYTSGLLLKHSYCVIWVFCEFLKPHCVRDPWSSACQYWHNGCWALSEPRNSSLGNGSLLTWQFLKLAWRHLHLIQGCILARVFLQDVANASFGRGFGQLGILWSVHPITWQWSTRGDACVATEGCTLCLLFVGWVWEVVHICRHFLRCALISTNRRSDRTWALKELWAQQHC